MHLASPAQQNDCTYDAAWLLMYHAEEINQNQAQVAIKQSPVAHA
jgi:hypothetical protein